MLKLRLLQCSVSEVEKDLKMVTGARQHELSPYCFWIEDMGKMFPSDCHHLVTIHML
jgi:hypothetical protein